jgi:hypothetical protein
MDQAELIDSAPCADWLADPFAIFAAFAVKNLNRKERKERKETSTVMESRDGCEKTPS